MWSFTDPPFDADGHRLRALVEDRPGLDARLIRAALVLAKQAHADTFRVSGDPAVSHPIAVATMIAAAGGNTDAVIASLLHDTLEDTPLRLVDIKRLFGVIVGRTVALLTKSVLHGEPPVMRFSDGGSVCEPSQLDSAIRNAMLIKVYDRIDNLRTAAVLPRWRRVRLADEAEARILPFARALRDDRAADALIRLARDQRANA